MSDSESDASHVEDINEQPAEGGTLEDIEKKIQEVELKIQEAEAERTKLNKDHEVPIYHDNSEVIDMRITGDLPEHKITPAPAAITDVSDIMIVNAKPHDDLTGPLTHHIMVHALHDKRPDAAPHDRLLPLNERTRKEKLSFLRSPLSRRYLLDRKMKPRGGSMYGYVAPPPNEDASVGSKGELKETFEFYQAIYGDCVQQDASHKDLSKKDAERVAAFGFIISPSLCNERKACIDREYTEKYGRKARFRGKMQAHSSIFEGEKDNPHLLALEEADRIARYKKGLENRKERREAKRALLEEERGEAVDILDVELTDEEDGDDEDDVHHEPAGDDGNTFGVQIVIKKDRFLLWDLDDKKKKHRVFPFHHDTMEMMRVSTAKSFERFLMASWILPVPVYTSPLLCLIQSASPHPLPLVINSFAVLRVYYAIYMGIMMHNRVLLDKYNDEVSKKKEELRKAHKNPNVLNQKANISTVLGDCQPEECEKITKRCTTSIVALTEKYSGDMTWCYEELQKHLKSEDKDVQAQAGTFHVLFARYMELYTIDMLHIMEDCIIELFKDTLGKTDVTFKSLHTPRSFPAPGTVTEILRKDIYYVNGQYTVLRDAMNGVEMPKNVWEKDDEGISHAKKIYGDNNSTLARVGNVMLNVERDEDQVNANTDAVFKQFDERSKKFEAELKLRGEKDDLKQQEEVKKYQQNLDKLIKKRQEEARRNVQSAENPFTAGLKEDTAVAVEE